MPATRYNVLLEKALEQYGYITTSDARELGIPPNTLAVMSHAGTLARIAHGVYRFPLVPVTQYDPYMEATLWARSTGVISHDSALDLWELCDISPDEIHLTIPKAARIRRVVPSGYRVYTRALSPPELASCEGIAVVSPERALLDALERRLPPHLVRQALDTAANRGLVGRDQQVRIRRRLSRHEETHGSAD